VPLPTWDLILGPAGVAVLALTILWLFVTERIIPRGRLEDQKAATTEALTVAKDANQTMEKMAEALEARNNLDAEAMRTFRESDRGRKERRR
jgi:hypothetical protein